MIMSRRGIAMPNVLKPLLFAVLPLALSACGSSNRPATATQTGAHNKPAAAANNTDPDMVAAVSASGSGPPISVRFRLDTKPIVGRPTQLVLAVTAADGIENSHVHGALQPAEGLLLQSPKSFDVDIAQGGDSVQQQVTVVPQRDGVLSLSASVVIDYQNTSLSRTYVIPLIAVYNAS
jgi:hypothetical protein